MHLPDGESVKQWKPDLQALPVLLELCAGVARHRDDIDTDRIIPARYLMTTDPAELAKHCMEDFDPEFAGRLEPGRATTDDQNRTHLHH